MQTPPWEMRIVVGPIQANCWVVRCPATGEVAVIDPGDEPERILKLIGTSSGAPPDRAPQVKRVLLTHGHLDHIGGAAGLQAALGGPSNGPPIALHRRDAPLYASLRQQGMMFGIPTGDPVPPSHFLEDGQVLEVGALRFEVIHTPGHTPGGVCFRLKGDEALGVVESVYSGDTLFKESIGRSDLPGGDHDALMASIANRLLVLGDGTRVCPGHGPVTTIGHERAHNPWLE